MVIVLESLCQPTQCGYLCLEACKEIHGKEAPLQIENSSEYPRVNGSTCTQCLSCLRACPEDAIIKSSIVNRRAVNRRSSTGTEQTKVYEVSETYEEFSEKNTIFARVRNDASFKNFGKDEFSGAESMIKKQIPDYGRFEHELSKSAWTVYNRRRPIQAPSKAENIPSVRGTNAPTNTPMIKKAAKFFGADMIGIAHLDRRWLYSTDRVGNPYDIPETIDRVIVMAIEMDYDAIATSPSFVSSAETGLVYSKMAFLEAELSNFIRRFGFQAIPCGNDVALSVPLAIDAGLGQYGRHGLLITREFGPRVRIAKILTDMPLETDQPDEKFCKAAIHFCETCEKCASLCPSGSIPFGKERSWQGHTVSNNPGIKKWYVNVESCYDFWIQNGCDCSNCIRSCPFNKRNGLLHRLVTWMVVHLSWLHSMIVKADSMLGYGKQTRSRKFWAKLKSDS